MIRARGGVINNVGGLIAAALVLLIGTNAATSSTKHGKSDECASFSCGNISNISYPFRQKGQPHRCGELELVCDDNLRTTLYLYHTKYYVEHMSKYTDPYQEMRLIDANIVDANEEKDYCSSSFVALTSFPYSDYIRAKNFHLYVWDRLNVLICSTPINSSYYIDYSPCINHTFSSDSGDYKYFYAAVLPHDRVYEIHQSCNITNYYPIYSDIDHRNLSISYIHNQLLRGFELSWRPVHCDYSLIICYDARSNKLEVFIKRVLILTINWLVNHQVEVLHAIGLTIAGFLTFRTSVGIVLLILLCVRRYHLMHLSIDDNIEDFLQNNNNFMPIRYSFSEIKKMTKGFKDKLGQGGFGMVYKAKLRSGRLVAIKLLGNKSKSKGQDFINEVATIGRIHHVNVVQLIGFCVEGSKRALVYNYMPNGSLDKFIFCNEENEAPLSWERMWNIALGVARGIEYLHRGCDMQILHFDIKPHNILLDKNFVPKVSDFGLAKLYSTNNSNISLTAVRGTLGYIAPELFYKNIGAISYKADVYSFGMLLMEMVGRRRNLKADAAHSSQIYFPLWIYDRVNQGEDIELGSDVTEEVKKLVRKMTIVATWCIQMKPEDRPSMTKVLQMLEGEAEELQIPPKPFFHPQDNPTIEEEGASSSTSSYDINISTTTSICEIR